MREAVRCHGGSGSPTPPEAQLIARVLADESDVFHDLVRPHERTIYFLTLRILRNAQEAEDVVQDTVLKALKNLHRFRAESKFSTWLPNPGRHSGFTSLLQRWECLWLARFFSTLGAAALLIAENSTMQITNGASFTMDHPQLHGSGPQRGKKQ